MNLTELLQSIANAIRTKTGKTETINAQDFPNEITNIKSISNLKTVTLSSSAKTYGSGNNTFTLDFSSSLSYVIGVTYIKTSNPQNPRANNITISINNNTRVITVNWYKTSSDAETNNTVSITAIGY